MSANEVRQTDQIQWNAAGLIPAVAQNAITGDIVMVAWMNKLALDTTIASGFAHFYSRSRKKLWKKGETSGNTLRIHKVLTDCDKDTILLLVNPAGPTCHTGAISCFHYEITKQSTNKLTNPTPATAIASLEQTMAIRKLSGNSETSYTKALLDKGSSKINEKIIEEAEEFCEQITLADQEKIAEEYADLLYHAMVGLTHSEVSIHQVWQKLAKRAGISGLVEKASRTSPTSDTPAKDN